MRLLPLLTAATLAIGNVGASSAPAHRPEEQIAKALAGRVAGKPTDCLYQRNIRSSTIIDHTAILYEMNDGTIYLNRPTSGASFLRSDYALVTDTHSTQLCSIDIVRLFDTVSRFESGTLGLGPFVPYFRPDRAQN